MKWQLGWAGNNLVNFRLLTTDPDVPNEQLRPILIGPDPYPIRDARPPAYAQQNAAPTPGMPVVGGPGLFVLGDSELGSDDFLGGSGPSPAPPSGIRGAPFVLGQSVLGSDDELRG